MLLVDDELYTREGIMASVEWEELGIQEIMQADDGMQALEIAGWFFPDIVLTDIKMPKLDGIMLVEQLLKINPNTKILFMSSYMEINYLKSAISLSAIDYIQKPVNHGVLLDSLKKAVQQIEKENVVKKNTEDVEKLRRQVLAVMLTYEKYDKTTVKNLLHYISIPPYVQKFRCIILQGNHPMLQAVVKENASQREWFCISARRKDQYYIAILGAESLVLDEVEEFSQNILRLLPNISLSVGTEVNTVEEINSSYSSAERALEKQFFLENQRLFLATESDEAPSSINVSALAEFSCLVEKNSPHIQAWIEDFNKTIAEGNYHIDQIRGLYFSMINTVLECHPALGNKLGIVTGVAEPVQIWEVMRKVRKLVQLQMILQEVIDLFLLENSLGNVSSCIREVIHFVQENYSDYNLSINQIADKVYLSPNYLNASFKKEMNKTLKQYIIDCRVERAKEMLRERKYKIKDIASECGFADSGYFTKAFRKEVGMTPIEYREKLS